MIIDLSAAVASLSGDISITVDRPNPNTWAAGGVSNAQTFTSSIVDSVSVQPISGRDLDKMPEGIRASEVLTIYAPGFVLNEKDRLTIPGRGVFQVIRAWSWGDPIGGYSKALAKALNASEPRS